MSRPENILSKYSSYSYHHFLMVCANSETAQYLSEQSEIYTFLQLKERGSYEPRYINEDERYGYVVVIDGIQKADFYIDEVSWENIVVSPSMGTGNTSSTTISLEGRMEIKELMGTRFLKILTDACNALGADPLGLTFVLKTIFVGRYENGGTEMITTIRPLLFIPYDISATFSSSGAFYHIEFTGISNGFSKLPQPQAIVNGLSFKLTQDMTIAEAVDKITEKLNENYDTFRKKVLLDYSLLLYKNGVSQNTDDLIRRAREAIDNRYSRVKYKIYADDYSDVRYKLTATDSSRSISKDEPIPISFNGTIESILDRLMYMSEGVVNDSKGVGTSNNKKYGFKIVSTLNYKNGEYIVEYFIKKSELFTVNYDDLLNGKDFVPPKGATLEFDYMFTGNNIDILEFDLKMEMGLQFYQLAATTNSLPSQKETINGYNQNIVRGTGAPIVAGNGNKQRKKTPLFLGNKIQTTFVRNKRNSVSAASFNSLLSRFASLEMLEAKMKIMGNPHLLNDLQILPNEIRNISIDNIIERDNTINPNWITTPTFIKVNIKFPKDPDNLNAGMEDFWYPGYYMLFSVNNIFSKGSFTQELDMMSLPVSDIFGEVSDKTANLTKESLTKKEKELRDALGLKNETKDQGKMSASQAIKAQNNREYSKKYPGGGGGGGGF